MQRIICRGPFCSSSSKTSQKCRVMDFGHRTPPKHLFPASSNWLLGIVWDRVGKVYWPYGPCWRGKQAFKVCETNWNLSKFALSSLMWRWRINNRLAVTICWPLARGLCASILQMRPFRRTCAHLCSVNRRTDGRTDGPTDGRTDGCFIQIEKGECGFQLAEHIKITLPPISKTCQTLSFQLFQKSACSARTNC